MSSRLPNGAESYKHTPTFTETSVPAALLKDHSTKPGTRGLIYVEQGRLRYAVTDAAREPTERILTPDSPPGLVEPTILHWVEPLGEVRFRIEFFRVPINY